MPNFRLPVLAAALLLVIQDAALAAVTTCGAAGTCKHIEASISADSAVMYLADTFEFGNDTHHWMSSSSQIPACVLEAGSSEDLSVAMKIIGQSRTPFAIMSGGHASNPGFSSTTGVHISLKQFNRVVFSKDNSTVEVGTGWRWADLYTELEGTGYNVVGGRTTGPGVGGFTLGGGYSWKTNQFGLTCDTVKSYNVVLPDGTITRASATDNPELFFALKGGLNRFGVVTSVELYTHKQPPQVYGGINVYVGDAIDAILAATATFAAENNDTKAQVITSLQVIGAVGTIAIVNFFYDGPVKSPSFDVFDGIPTLYSTVQTQNFSSFVGGIPDAPVPNLRGAFASFSTSELTPDFLAAIRNEFNTVIVTMSDHGGATIGYDIEPFTLYGEHATDSAYPHSKSPLPLNLYYAWTSPADDDYWRETMTASVNRLKEIAAAEGIYDAAEFTIYPNYAIANTTAEELYGENTQRLREIKQRFDPRRIMDLAGGFAL